MKTISATNLRVQLRDLLADLDTGPVSITKHGKVVAVLSAPDEPVEAIEATPPTEYIPKALAPPQKKLRIRSMGSMLTLKPTFRRTCRWTGPTTTRKTRFSLDNRFFTFP